MKIRKLPKIQLDEKHFPYHWEQNLVANQEIGGVFFVFLSGKTQKEINLKMKLIKKYCKTLKSQMRDFAQVKPL